MAAVKARKGLNLPSDVFKKIEEAQTLMERSYGISSLSKAQVLDKVLTDFIKSSK